MTSLPRQHESFPLPGPREIGPLRKWFAYPLPPLTRLRVGTGGSAAGFDTARSLTLLLLGWLILVPVAWSQTDETPGAAAEAGRMRIDESPLETVYLRRDDGSYVPYFEIPFEVFEKLYEQYIGGQGDVLPEAFTTERLEVVGVVSEVRDGEIADLDLKLRVQPHRDGWIRVPLKLGNSTLTSWSKGNASDTTLVSVDGKGEYVAWIRGKENQSVELSLQVVSRVGRQANQRSLRLALPTAAVAQMTIDLPTDQPGISLSSEKLLPRTDPLPGGRTRLLVAGASGELEIRWRAAVASAASGLSVVTDMTVQVDGPDLIRYQVALDVTSLNGQDRSFLLRMPSGTRFDAAEQLDLEVTELVASDPRVADFEGDFAYLQVTFPKPLEKPARVVLFASRSGVTMEDTGASQQIELGRFEVVDAVRQSGAILLLSSRDWRIDWRPGSFVRQVSLEPNDRERATAVARFRFSRAPIELNARIYRNESRIACEPIFDVLFGIDQLRLSARLNYAFSGPRPDELLVDLRGWMIDDTQLSGNRFVRRLSRDTENPDLYRLDLDPSVPEDAFELTLELTQPIDRLGSVAVPLLLPIASTVSPALVTLRTVENLELIRPIATSMGNLQPIESVETPAGDDSRVQVRVPSLDTIDHLDCNVRLRQQRKTIVSTVQANRNSEGWEIQQSLIYEVRFAPLESGYLMVDRSLITDGNLDLRLDDQPLRFQPVESSFESLEQNQQLIQFELPRPLTGRFSLQARFRLPPKANREQPDRETLDLPIVVPVQRLDTSLLPLGQPLLGPLADIQVLPLGDLAKTIVVNLPNTMNIAAHDGRWQLEETSLTVDARQVTLSKLDQDPVQSLSLTLATTRDNQSLGSTRVRAWVQSLMTPRFRRDRVTLVVETRQPRIELDLPAFAQLSELAVDGVLQSGAAERVNGTTLIVDFERDSGQAEHTLELWYRFPNDRKYQRWLDFELPKFEVSSWIDQIYWEVVLPPDEFLAAGPPESRFRKRATLAWCLGDGSGERFRQLARAVARSGSSATTVGPTSALPVQWIRRLDRGPSLGGQTVGNFGGGLWKRVSDRHVPGVHLGAAASHFVVDSGLPRHRCRSGRPARWAIADPTGPGGRSLGADGCVPPLAMAATCTAIRGPNGDSR